MTALKEVKSLLDVVDHFKELPFYNKNIKKPKIRCLKNTDLLSELPFYEVLNVIKTNHAFKGYAMSYKVEVTETKNSIKWLQVSIKNLFSDLLNETKGLRYQITLKVMLKNTSQMGKLNLNQFILIQQQKQ